MFIGYFFSSKINISSHDLFLGFLSGFFQVGVGFILITVGARNTPSAMIGIIMFVWLGRVLYHKALRDGYLNDPNDMNKKNVQMRVNSTVVGVTGYQNVSERKKRKNR